MIFDRYLIFSSCEHDVDISWFPRGWSTILSSRGDRYLSKCLRNTFNFTLLIFLNISRFYTLLVNRHSWVGLNHGCFLKYWMCPSLKSEYLPLMEWYSFLLRFTSGAPSSALKFIEQFNEENNFSSQVKKNAMIEWIHSSLCNILNYSLIAIKMFHAVGVNGHCKGRNCTRERELNGNVLRVNWSSSNCSIEESFSTHSQFIQPKYSKGQLE